jgi:hypothetical protein
MQGEGYFCCCIYSFMTTRFAVVCLVSAADLAGGIVDVGSDGSSVFGFLHSKELSRFAA